MKEDTRHLKFTRATLCLAVLTFASTGHAQSQDNEHDETDEKRFSAEVSAGLEYSSNVSIDELDVVSDTSDIAALLGFELGYELDITSKTSFDIEYSFSQTIHEELDQFNLLTHFGRANLSQDLGRVGVGLSYRYLDASLDGPESMNYRQAAPYLTALFGKTIFVRAEYGHADKEFDVDLGRDAEVESFGTDWFYFLGSPRNYFLVGYRNDQHDAISTEYVYEQDNFKLHFVKRFDVFGRPGKLNVGLRYETRDYEFITASIGVPREEERLKFRLSLELPFTDHVGTIFKYEVRDIESNLPEANRSEQVGSIKFVANF